MIRRLFSSISFFSLALIFIFICGVNSYAGPVFYINDLEADEGTSYYSLTVINDIGQDVYYTMVSDQPKHGDRILRFYLEDAPGRTKLSGDCFNGSTYDYYVYVNECYGKNKPVNPPLNESESIHSHDFIEGTIYEATSNKDGLGGIYCKTCGAIKESWPISAYGYSLNDYATPMINTSKSGQTVTFEFGEWNSFPKAFMEKIAAKSTEGVTFVFHYKWNHVKQEITIPAGTIVDLSFDYYGPAKMAELYGLY